MQTEEILHTTGETIEYAKQYIGQQMDYLRLEVAERSAKSISLLVTVFVVAFLAVMTIGFLFLTLGLWLGEMWKDYPLAFLCVTAFYALTTILVFKFRQKLVTNPILSQIIKSMLE